MRAIVFLVFCSPLLLSHACRSDEQIPKRNVLIVTLDTFRPDHVNASDMPFLTRYLKSARLFTAARTVVPLTLPSHASLFSGLLPSRMRVHDNVGSPIPPTDDRDYSLLAEEFRAAGYRTGAIFASKVLQPRTGICAGFEHAHGPQEGNDATGVLGYHPAKRQVGMAQEWLAQVDERPTFLWLHFYDAHHPFMPFDGGPERKATTAKDSRADRYRGELRRLDRWLERLFANIPSDTIVVLASDHGEGLDEHGETTHGLLCYGNTVDQFLAVRGLEPGVDQGPRSMCDIAPTLRAMCGLPSAETDGRRLDGPAASAVVSESLLAWRLHGWGQVLAAADGRYTLIESGSDVHLFDRFTDPGEQHPLDPSGHPAYERLDRAIRRLRETSSKSEMDIEVLGSTTPYGSMRRPFSHYLSRAANAALQDPEPLLDWWTRTSDAQQDLIIATARRDFLALELLVETIVALAAESPSSPVPHQLLGQLYDALGGITKKRAHNLACIESCIRSVNLGFVLPELFATGLRCSFRMAGHPGMRRLVALAVDTGLVPNIDAAHAFYAAAIRDGSLSDEATILLRRTSARAGPNRSIDEWIEELVSGP